MGIFIEYYIDLYKMGHFKKDYTEFRRDGPHVREQVVQNLVRSGEHLHEISCIKIEVYNEYDLPFYCFMLGYRAGVSDRV